MSQFVVADGMSKSINKHTRHENCAKSAKGKSIILLPTNPEAEVVDNENLVTRLAGRPHKLTKLLDQWNDRDQW